MLNRCESRQRNYTELCNRSSTGSHGMSHVGTPMPYNCDTFEDYWEDASVSLRSSHSWEPTSSRATTSSLEKIAEDDESKRFSALGSPQIRPPRYSFDVNEYIACLKGRRTFPPPLASCSTVSIKEGGRFVLKEMDADRSQGFLRAQRGNGRLRLQLVLPDEANDEEDNHEESSSPVEDMIEFGHTEHDAQVEETSHEDCSTADKDGIRSSINEVGRCGSFDSSEGPWAYGHVCEAEDFEIGRPTVQNVGPEVMEFLNVCSTSQDVDMDARYDILDKQQVGIKNSKSEGETISASDGFYSDDPHRDISNCGKEVGFLKPDTFLTDSFLTYGKLELNQFVVESNKSNVEQEPLWNVDVSNQALASLSPWSPKQMCLHQPIVCMRPALGLAMS